MVHNDIAYLGTLGFAQVGNPKYSDMIVVEKKVITAYFHSTQELQVPNQFLGSAYFKWAQCPHEVHYYWDFQLIYNESGTDEDIEALWEWINICESALGRNDEFLLEQCRELYAKSIVMEVVYTRIDDHFNLKSV